MHALPEQAQNKLLGYRSFCKKLLGHQKQMLPAIHEGPNSEAITDLNYLKGTTDLNLEATTGLEATSSTTTVAEPSTSASAVPFESLTLSSACAWIASDLHTRIQFGSVFLPSPDGRILRRSLCCHWLIFWRLGVYSSTVAWISCYGGLDWTIEYNNNKEQTL
jgi:hypothetical protein